MIWNIKYTTDDLVPVFVDKTSYSFLQNLNEIIWMNLI